MIQNALWCYRKHHSQIWHLDSILSSIKSHKKISSVLFSYFFISTYCQYALTNQMFRQLTGGCLLVIFETCLSFFQRLSWCNKNLVNWAEQNKFLGRSWIEYHFSIIIYKNKIRNKILLLENLVCLYIEFYSFFISNGGKIWPYFYCELLFAILYHLCVLVS